MERVDVSSNVSHPDTYCGCVLLVYPFQGWGRPAEAYFAWLRLPFFGYEYQPVYDKYMWSQLVLAFHGWHGFRTYWRIAK